MEHSLAPTTTRRELAYRSNAGIEVSLFWTKVGDVLTVEVYDSKSDEFFALDVPKSCALDAFRHPFAYLAVAEAQNEGFLLAA